MSHSQRSSIRKPHHKDGAWLCSAGPYLNYISNMNASNPGIGNMDPKNEHIGSRVGQSRSTLLELKLDGTWSCEPFQSAMEIRNHFTERSDTLDHSAKSFQRIYIMEGLDPEYVEVYGSYFLMDPTFFVRHERNDLWNLKSLESHIHDPSPLPSVKDPETYFRAKYREVRQFGPQLRDWRTTCGLTGRHIAAIGFHGALDSVGAVARKLSFWSQKHTNGGWDVVILCDPAIQKVHVVDREGHSVRTENFRSEPFQGGYNYNSIVNLRIDPKKPQLLEVLPRTCLLDDLCFFYKHRNNKTNSSTTMLPNSETPLTAAVLPLKIVCAQYVKLIDYFEVILQRLARTEWRLSRQSDYLDSKYPEVEEQWSSLQLTRVRLSTYIDDLEEIIGDIAIPAAQSSSYSIPVEWQDIKKDFQYIHGCLQKMKGRVDEAITSAMGLSNIVGSKQALSEARRSVKEAKSTKTLTVVGLVFIPLAYTCALFSMSDQFRPGSSLFWVYFAVSVPLIVLVFAGTFLIQLGYDEGAAWSLGQFKKAWLGKTL